MSKLRLSSSGNSGARLEAPFRRQFLTEDRPLTGTAQRKLAEEAAFVLSVIAEVIKVAAHHRPPYVFRVTDLKKIEKLL